MKKVCRYLLTLLVLGGTSFALHADDTEIYFTANASTTDEPLVMFSLDWRPNLSSTVCDGNECDALYDEGYLDKDPASETVQAFDLYRAVLKKVFASLEGVKVGLMINHDQGGGRSCSGPQREGRQCTNGGFMAFGFESLQAGDGNGAKAAFDAQLARLPVPQGNASHKYQGAELFFEFFRYLAGGAIHNAHNGWTDFGTNDTQNIDEESHGFSWDTTIETDGGTRYVSPLRESSACAKIFTINIMFGVSQQDGDSDAAITANKADGGMSNINLRNNARLESVLAWLRDTDLADGSFGTAPDLTGLQNVHSYFLVPSPSNTEHGYAESGGTNQAYTLSDDPDELVATLRGIFNEILSVSTSFVSASVPVNVYNRAQTLDNIYIGLFQPKDTNNWPGNIKKLKLARNEFNDLLLVDSNLQPAIAADGRIKYDALTFWTEASALPYPDPNITGPEIDEVVAGKDGRFVPRGGAGQRIPGITGSGSNDPGLTNSGLGARQLFTEPATGTTLLALNADDVTASELQTALGATDETQALCLLKYARGYDVVDIDSCDSPGVRSWLMGDTLHSRPLPMNYGGNTSDPDIRILVGSNDGFMRMFRNTENAAQSGAEVWAFMPRKVMPVVKTLQANGVRTRTYGVDGAPVSYRLDVDRDGTIETAGGDKVWLFFGLRRGGKAYYALDISDPDAPRFMWKITPGGDFAELGLTFSTPRVGYLDWGSGVKPVLIFAGGYDVNKDTRPGPGTDDSEGNALFVVDAATGALVWKAAAAGSASASVFVQPTLADSIPSEPAALDATGNGLLDRVYVGDTGGVLWRADFPGNNRNQWTLKPVLSVGRHATSADRRFFHRPDVAFSKDAAGPFDGVAIGTGDRANPLERTISNELYLFKDRHIHTGTPPTTALNRKDLADLTDNCLQDEDLNCATMPDLTHGWHIALEQAGEKVLAAPATLAGTVFFTTYRPAEPGENQCGPSEGGGALYAVKLQDATAVFNRNTGTDNDGGGLLQKEDRLRMLSSGGIPAEVVPLFVSKNLTRIGDSTTAGTNNPVDDIMGFLAPDLIADSLPSQLSWKTFWYQEMQ